MDLGRSSSLFLKAENFQVASVWEPRRLRTRARLQIEHRPAKNQILGLARESLQARTNLTAGGATPLFTVLSPRGLAPARRQGPLDQGGAFPMSLATFQAGRSRSRPAGRPETTILRLALHRLQRDSLPRAPCGRSPAARTGAGTSRSSWSCEPSLLYRRSGTSPSLRTVSASALINGFALVKRMPRSYM
jgi:hypothetical protein